MTDEMKAKRELLFSGSKNGYDRVDQQTLDAMEAYCRDYKSFLDHSKTERECTAHTVALAEAAGFIPYERGMALQYGEGTHFSRKRNLLDRRAAHHSRRGYDHQLQHGLLLPVRIVPGEASPRPCGWHRRSYRH